MTGRVLGAILAGGASRRFGSDKALALLDGVTLIDRAIAAMQAEVDALVICGRTYPPYVTVADRPRAGLGPLGALAGALHHAATQGFTQVLTLPCDVPFPPCGLRAMLDREGGAYLPECPVIGLWPAATAAALDAHLAADGDRSVRGWAEAIGATAVPLGRPLANVNRIADLAQLADRSPSTPWTGMERR